MSRTRAPTTHKLMQVRHQRCLISLNMLTLRVCGNMHAAFSRKTLSMQMLMPKRCVTANRQCLKLITHRAHVVSRRGQMADRRAVFSGAKSIR